MAVHGIIGRKLGMTQVYAEDGAAVPATVIQAGPCVVVQRKSQGKDGYAAVQLGLVENRKVEGGEQGACKGHFEKAALPPCQGHCVSSRSTTRPRSRSATRCSVATSRPATR